MIRSSSSRSSGSWPIVRGLRSFGWTSRSVRATLRSPHSTTASPACARLARVGVHRLEELHLRREVLAAVGHVDRRDRQPRQPRDRDAGLEVERRVHESRGARGRWPSARGARRRSTPCRRASSTSSPPSRRGRRDLVGRRLDLLQADHVGLLARDPLLDLRLPRADAVDVPGRNLEHGKTARRGSGRGPNDSWAGGVRTGHSEGHGRARQPSGAKPSCVGAGVGRDVARSRSGGQAPNETGHAGRSIS